MTTELPHHLSLNEREAITAVSSALTTRLGVILAHLYLFGSKARGDSYQDSDIDLLVIVHGLDADIRWSVRATAADYSLEYDVLFNTHIYDADRWQTIVSRQDTLWREVARDGIPLDHLLTQPSARS